MRRFNRKHWERVYMKVGTLPGLHYFVAKADMSKLTIGGWLQVRIDDGVTKPQWQHAVGVLIDEIRSVVGGVLYVAQKF